MRRNWHLFVGFENKCDKKCDKFDENQWMKEVEKCQQHIF